MTLVHSLSQQEWLDRFDTEKTKIIAMCAKKAFDRFISTKYGQSESEVLRQLKEDEYSRYLFLDRMVQFWYNDGKTCAVKTYFPFVRDWLKVNGIRTDLDEIKEYVKFRKQYKERKIPLSYDDIRTLLHYANAMYRALILWLVSSGMRVGEAVQITTDNIRIVNGTVLVNIPAAISKTKEERITCVSSEAWRAVQKMIHGKRIFVTNPKAAEQYMKRLRIKTGMMGKYRTGTHHVTLHVLRSFFISKGNKVEDGFGHALAGHGRYMKSYERYTEEEIVELYKKLEPYVTIHNDQRLRAENWKLRNQDDRIAELERQLERMRQMHIEKLP